MLTTLAQEAANAATGTATSDPLIEQLTQRGVDIAINAMAVLAILLVAIAVATWVRRWVQRGLMKVHFDATLSKFFAQLAKYAVLVMALIFCLSKFGVQTASLAAVIAAAGLAIGLAFQGTLSNFAAGVMLLTFRPFKVGDAVNINGEVGSVDEIELFFTYMNTFDNRRIIMPNAQVFGAKIENMSHHPVRRTDVPVGVDYSADIDKTRETLLAAVKSVEGQAPDKEPAVVLSGLGDSSVDWTVRVWAPAADLFPVREATIRAIKYYLDEANISIPFPQMDVHFDNPVAPPADAVTTAANDGAAA
ncbi:mechanosensitive ion channel family protein [Phycisphaerales bacterium AB-hyl4]|uniref:Mechanosensitive ion channel family protein n=1 Tax=Natronomicrosphaera hydrolytica TaxID=3242702 RepID=A0ABV4U6H9_9BACT